MVCLAPPLKAVLEIRLMIENGHSVSQAIQIYAKKHLDDEFAKELGLWLFASLNGRSYHSKIFETFYRKRLLEILSSGLKGSAILNTLAELEEDLIFISHENLEQQIQKLPLISLIPLMLFELPAFFLLLTGPLILNLLSALQN